VAEEADDEFAAAALVDRDELKRSPGGEVEEYDKDAKPDSD
jgi:hypothetical protein